MFGGFGSKPKEKDADKKKQKKLSKEVMRQRPGGLSAFALRVSLALQAREKMIGQITAQLQV